MQKNLHFENLVDLCKKTHEECQRYAIRAVDTSLVMRNWFFGYYIIEYEQHGEDRATYGVRLLEALATHLKGAGVKGISTTNLKLSRQFYCIYREIGQRSSAPLSSPNIRQTLSDHFKSSTSITNTTVSFLNRFTLSWSHYVTLLTIDSDDERRFYEIEATANNWSVRELERQIDVSLYERLALNKSKTDIHRLGQNGHVIEKAADLIKDPVILEFLGLEEKIIYSENDLENAIITHLQKFLLELGKGFLFEARQKRFTFDNDHFFVDLVFYNRLLHCYVLIDLKRNKLTHQDLGQMQMYVNYFDRYVKTEDELPTIGIVLCHRKNDALVELTLPKEANIFASKYQLFLPSKEELKLQLERIEAALEHKPNTR